MRARHNIAGLDRDLATQIADLTRLPFVTAPDKIAVQGAYDDLLQLSATLKTLAVSLRKIAVRVMCNNVAATFGGAGECLEMNVCMPLMIFNITKSIRMITDGCIKFRRFLVEGTKPNLKQIARYVERSLKLITALTPRVGFHKASDIAHYTLDHDLKLKEAALQLRAISEAAA
jgi:fumarate hydratase class II